MATTPEEYARELERILADIGGIVAGSEDAMTAILEEARQTIQAHLATLDLESGTRVILERAMAGTDEALTAMRARLEAEAREAAETAFDAGAALASRPVGAEFAVGSAAITTDRLGILTQFSADLIQTISNDVRRRINGELVSVIVGAKTPGEAARAIGRNLTDPNHFRTIAHRARAIVVTEVGRAQALGTQAAQEHLAAGQRAVGGPQPRKRWLNAHLPGARATHLAAEARYAPGGDPGPIPIGERFIIAGIAALYPRDPTLPARESVNCHCVSLTVITDADEEAVSAARSGDARDAYSRGLGK